MAAPRLGKPAEEIEKDRAARKAEIDAKLRTLSVPEQDLLKQLTQAEEGDLSELARFALTLMAGNRWRRSRRRLLAGVSRSH